MKAKEENRLAIENLQLEDFEAEALAQAYERTEADPLAFVELGRLYANFVKEAVEYEWEASRRRFALTDKVRTL